ncbi:MAG TPA: PPOX class F420-dependent oxidoreductase [Nocardioidaceae bacterium]|nr:PPOX class F420-dependent oxidoreductase [Nocardioidaceae bacterium]
MTTIGHRAALELARASHQGTLVTIRGNGRPQLSNVLHALSDDRVVRISTTPGRAKTANLRRTPWGALHVNGPDFWSYAVLEGAVTMTAPVVDADDQVMAELRDHYRAMQGEPDDWEPFHELMLTERRLVVRLHADRGYGFRLDQH